MTPRDAVADRHTTDAGVAALLRLAELDAALRRRVAAERDAAAGEATAERRALAARVPRDVLDWYHRAVRGGRQPPVVRVVEGVCHGCFVRLHAKLEQQFRHRGVASCPRCLRVVYDAEALRESPKEALGRR
jgi:predicted  nucleic acid-binding Zn-ribbon protein